MASLLLSAAAAAAGGLPSLRGYSIAAPSAHSVVRRSGNSTLYEAALPSGEEYQLGPVLVAQLTGGRRDIGRAYSELLGNETLDAYELFASKIFPNAAQRALYEEFADWLWNRFESKYVPAEFLEELEGMREASPPGRTPSVDVVTRRVSTIGNLPADTQNLATALEQELEKGMPPVEAALVNRVIASLLHCTWCGSTARARRRVPGSTGCDAFGAWGSRTEGGRLFTSRNLDWNKDTGVARYKLVTIITVPGVEQYATFGFAQGIQAIAGMSRAGVTVSEMNLDNSLTTFDGPPFPLRLRMLLERSRNLAEAEELWRATNNTDSMNYLIGAARDGTAVAVEAIRGFSAFFGANDPVETAATCTISTSCTGTGGKDCGGTCGDAFPNATGEDGGVLHIGRPLKDAVFRTNHALHPTVMRTQEPLFNDTTFRYQLLHDMFADYAARGVKVGAAEAVAVVATLGIKGPDFFSCDAAQFSSSYAENVLSAAYAPDASSGGHAYVAWEDGEGEAGWRPAACNTYVDIDLSKWW